MPEFMNRLRLVSSMLPPGLWSSGGLYGTPSAERLRGKALASADVWLDTTFAAGVSGADFWFLDDFSRSRVEGALDRFIRAAEPGAAGSPLTTEQRVRGLDALCELVLVLQPVDMHGKLFAHALWDLEDRYPEYVLGFSCEFGTDSTGDPAVWVWVVVPDETDVQTPAFDGFMDDVTRAARSWLERAGLPHWPYTRLLTPSDIKDEIAEVVE